MVGIGLRHIILGGAIVVLILLGWLGVFNGGGHGEITSFEECVSAGNPVMESYPRQCRDGKGNLFVEDVELSTE